MLKLDLWSISFNFSLTRRAQRFNWTGLAPAEETASVGEAKETVKEKPRKITEEAAERKVWTNGPGGCPSRRRLSGRASLQKGSATEQEVVSELTSHSQPLLQACWTSVWSSLSVILAL